MNQTTLLKTRVLQAAVLKQFTQAALLIGSTAALLACSPEQPMEAEESGTAAAAPSQASVGQDYSAREEQSNGRRWECPENPGEAPGGTLVAERIPGTEPQGEHTGLYEGPVWIEDSLYFSHFTFEEGFPSNVMRMNPDGSVEVAIENGGSNGHSVDSEGYLMAATHDMKAISRYELETGDREIVWDEYAGNPFNSPNDLTLTRDGVIYFTDPGFQRSAAPGGQPKTRVYRIGEDGISVVDDTMSNPNGVSLSPDEKTLYVAGGGEQGVLRAYSLDEDGGVAGQQDLADVAIPDGMAIDCLGNIYVTEHARQRVRVFTPEGEQLAQIRVDANITNAAFGGPERKTLYLTGAGTLWQIELDVAGFPY